MSSEKKRKQVIGEYIRFVLDNQPDDSADTEKFDRRRKALHDKVVEAFADDPGVAEVIRSYGVDHAKGRFFQVFYNVQDLNDKVFESDFDGLVEYHYWAVVDNIGNEKYNGVKTNYHIKSVIDAYVDRLERRLDKQDALVRKIVDGFDKARLAYNDANHLCMDDDGYQSSRWFSHDYAGIVSSARRDIKLMRQFAALPREAYTQAAVDQFYNQPFKHVESQMTRMRSLAFACLDHWKHDSKCWDPAFDW